MAARKAPKSKVKEKVKKRPIKASSKKTPVPKKARQKPVRLLENIPTVPWAPSVETIFHLTDIQLNQLMTEILKAEAYKCEADISKVVVNTEIKAGDEGADAVTPKLK